MVTPLGKKLGLRPGSKIIVINAPPGYLQMLGDLPAGAEISSGTEGDTLEDAAFDSVQVFLSSKDDADRLAPEALRLLAPDGLLWLAFPKKSSGLKTDISRDTGWDSLHNAGWEMVTLISVDDTWSAGRFRPSADIKSGKRQ